MGVIVLLAAVLIAAATQTQTQSLPKPKPKPECPTITKCGSVNIPFPFGLTEDCSLDSSFVISCNQTSSPHTPFLPTNNLTVLDISLNGELRVAWPVASDCYGNNGTLVSETPQFFDLMTPPNPNPTFHLSSTRNKLMVVGCDTFGLVLGYDAEEKNYTTGCMSLCNRLDDIVANGSCSGVGCCQTSIPQRLSSMTYSSFSLDNHTNVIAFNPCGYTFLVEDGAYNFTSTDLVRFETTAFPVVVDWAVGNQTCREAKKEASSYACKADSSECHDSPEGKGTGYLCNCSAGFQGNPYLLNGCQDVDECMKSNNCIPGAICSNFPGAYNCSCPQGYKEGYEGDDKRCIPISNTNSNREIILIIALSVSVSIIAILVASFYVYRTMKKRKLIKLKQQFFHQNGGLLLQQQIARHRGSAEMAKVFTIEELKEATNNFDEGRVLGQGGQGTVYKGLLVDNRIVAIKKSRIGDPKQIEQFINEVILLSQINHRNVVKLLGCCLETEFPLLVYEFIPNVHFVSSMKEGRLLDIVDKDIIDEANVEQLMVVANIAKMCLRVNGEERPTMKEVAMELEGMMGMEKHRWESVNLSSEEAENLLKATVPAIFNVEDGTVSGSGISSSGFDSLNHISMSLGGGR
ncbi:Wall-associated receptor kinase, galacturonan-binding domain [Sesbania bispinosa]|nr:Wall-associated receptor kinase, galacturonan-binding domain [Sesbania bispinosa]